MLNNEVFSMFFLSHPCHTSNVRVITIKKDKIMNENLCLELRQDDIVRVDVYLASQCSMPVPAQVNSVQFINSNLFTGDPVLTLTLPLGDDTPMQDVPTLKVQNARQASGNVYTHDLQAAVQLARQQVESAIEALNGKDFYVVYTRNNGAKDLSYALPNASMATIDETQSNNSVTTLKIKLQSMSALIRLASPTN